MAEVVPLSADVTLVAVRALLAELSQTVTPEMLRAWHEMFMYQGFDPKLIRTEAMRKAGGKSIEIARLITLSKKKKKKKET